MNKHPIKLTFFFLTMLFLLMQSAACGPENAIPAVLSQKDFAYWTWDPDIKPDSPIWRQVIPPKDLTEHFTLAGYAGDKETVAPNEEWAADCHSAPSCTKIVYSPDSGGLGWAGNLWVDVLYPQYSQGIYLGYVKQLTFWVKGENGGEKVEFRIGGTEGITPQPAFSTGVITLQKSWQPYTIELTDKAYLDRVFSGFSWLSSIQQNPDGCTFYLDDMQFK